MPKGSQVQTLRGELLAARANVLRQIEILESPLRSYDQYPEGIAKLRATLADIDVCLADQESAPA